MKPNQQVYRNRYPEYPWKKVVFGHTEDAELPLRGIMAADDLRLGLATTRWTLSWKERLMVLFTGSVWVQILTYHQPIPPIKLLASEPFRGERVK